MSPIYIPDRSRFRKGNSVCRSPSDDQDRAGRRRQSPLIRKLLRARCNSIATSVIGNDSVELDPERGSDGVKANATQVISRLRTWTSDQCLPATDKSVARDSKVAGIAVNK